MSGLPAIIRRVPSIFYGLAILFFVASWVLNVTEVNSAMHYGEPDNPAVRLAKLRGLYQAALDATFIAANGVVAHILLAIWAEARSRRAPGDQL